MLPFEAGDEAVGRIGYGDMDEPLGCDLGGEWQRAKRDEYQEKGSQHVDSMCYFLVGGKPIGEDIPLVNNRVSCSLAPWLTVQNGAEALQFYKAAFGAFETYRMEDPDGGVVARLSVDGAEFWVSDGAGGPEPLGGGSVRMILTVADPDAIFTQALSSGAAEVFPVSEDHGWRLGRLVDPFGLHWEIGHPL